MAEEKEDVAEGTEETPKKSKTMLFVGGGAVSLIAAGVMAAMMALPSKSEKPRMLGPFALTLFDGQFSCNLQGAGSTRFLRMSPEANYLAYDPTYLSVRTADELYPAMLQATVFGVASRKTAEQLLEGEINKSTFAEELRDSLDPILFPIHLGDTTLPFDFDEESGLRPGLSSSKTTFRGPFEDHLLNVSQNPMEMWVDEGPRTAFNKGEYDVRLISSEGNILFVDTSELKDEFEGQIKVGVRGRIIRIIPVDLLVQ